MQTDLRQYLPSYYDGVRETDELVTVQGSMFDNLATQMNAVLDNQFILTCSVQILGVWEQILNIRPNPDAGETEEFRRQRIINRLASRPPFSLWFLRQRLDAIIGRENYELKMDYDQYELELETAVENQAVFSEMTLTIYRVKPANIAFKLVPVLRDEVKVRATAFISQAEVEHFALDSDQLDTVPFEVFGRYKRVGVWEVGVTPILEFEEEKELRLF